MTTRRTSGKTAAAKIATLGLYVTEVREHGYYHLRANAVWIGRTPDEVRALDNAAGTVPYVPSDRIRNVDRYDYNELGLDLSNLLVNSQGGDSDVPRRLYGFEVEYREVYSIDHYLASRMAKTLGTIDRKMEKTNDAHGRPATFGAYLLRVAHAIGATRMVFTTKHAQRSDYGEREHIVQALKDGAYRADHLVAQWVEEPEVRRRELEQARQEQASGE